MPSQQNSGLPNDTDKTGTLLDSRTFLSPQGANFQDTFSSQGDLARTNMLHLGKDLCRWQTEARRVRLQPLFAPILLLAQRLLAAHRDWEVQEQMHLDYTSLEVRVRPDAELTLIECRWSEDVQLLGMGTLELRLATPPGFDVPACVFFVNVQGQTPPISETPANAQPANAQPANAQPGSPETCDYLEKIMDTLEGFLLQVLGGAEQGVLPQPENAVASEEALF